MIRAWARLAAVLAALAAPALPVSAQDLTIATTGTFPPFLFEDPEGVSGFDIDVMDTFCARAGLSCRYVVYPLADGLAAVESGAADIALGGIGITAAREAHGLFTCPYRQGRGALVPVFSPDPALDLDSGTARIAVMADTLSHQALIDEGYTAIPYPDLESAIRATLAGEVDAYHGNSNSLGLVPGAADRLAIVGAIAGEQRGAGFLVRRDRPRLLAALNDSFAALLRDGTLQEIGDRWFGPGNYAPPATMGITCTSVMSAL